MTIIRATDSLKCKVMTETLNEAAFRWYVSLPRFSITNYQDPTTNTIHYLSVTKHRKVSTIILFKVRQGYSETLREYIMCFNKETIKFAHPNQEIFVWAF